MDNQEAVLAAKKNVKRIRRAGFSALVLGFALILAGAGAIWLIQSETTAIIIFAGTVLIGLYFVFTGSYIKNVQGRKTKNLLLLNGIIALPLCALIFPIYVCIQSINNYSRYKDLPRQVQEIYKKHKGFKLKLWEIIVLSLILIGAGVSFVFKWQDLTKQATTQSTQVNNGPVDFSSKTYQFTMKFPAQPATTNFTLNDNGHTVPFTTHISHGTDGSQDYDVYAYSWPTQYYHFDKLSPDDMAKTISKSVDRYVTSRKGAIVSRQKTTYLDKLAEEAQFTSPTLSSPITGFIRVFYIGNFEYDVIALNTMQNDFSNFANTFQSTVQN